MSEQDKRSDDRRDWRISATLLAVWLVALIPVYRQRGEIPLSMIIMATVFFVILIPSMNDLVRSIEKRVFGNTGEGRDKD